MPNCPVIQTSRLTLRPLSLADAPRVALLAGDREIAATTLNIPHPYEPGMAEAWIATRLEASDKDESLSWAIVEREGDVLVGGVGLHLSLAHAKAELGYWVGKPYWGGGYATEAAGAVVAYGFRELGLHRIFAHHFANNPASGRVLEKVGMTPEGTLRGHYKKWDVYIDAVVYGMLRPE